MHSQDFVSASEFCLVEDLGDPADDEAARDFPPGAADDAAGDADEADFALE